MRLDKFLKLSRLIKRRTVANTLCDCGGVLLDGKVAKASSEVKIGQTLALLYGNRTITATIIGIPSVTQKHLAPEAMVSNISHTPVRQDSSRAHHPIDNDPQETVP
ncbi:MAG: RNA-binding S4 domain-containing protein [Vampirovibrionales bacterium]